MASQIYYPGATTSTVVIPGPTTSAPMVPPVNPCQDPCDPLSGAVPVHRVEDPGASAGKTIAIVVGIIILIILLFLVISYLFGWGKGKTVGGSCSEVNDPVCASGTTCSGAGTCQITADVEPNGSPCTSSAECQYGSTCQGVQSGGSTSGGMVCTPNGLTYHVPTNRDPAQVPVTDLHATALSGSFASAPPPASAPSASTSNSCGNTNHHNRCDCSNSSSSNSCYSTHCGNRTSRGYPYNNQWPWR